MSLSQRVPAVVRLSKNPWAQLLVGIAVSGCFAYLAVRSLAWGDVAESFRTFPVGLAALALIPVGAAMLLRAARWHVLLRGGGASFGQVVLAQNTGIGLNNLSPVRMLSEPVQLVLITRRYKVDFPTAFATLVGGNVLDIFATALLLGLGVALVPGLREGRVSIQLAGAVIMFVVSALVFVAVGRGLSSLPLAKRVRFFQQVVAAVALLRGRPGRLWASFGATLGHWFALGGSGWLLAQGLGIDVAPLAMVTVLVAATFFTSAVPSAPSGAGAYHFAVVLPLTALGADPEAAFSLALVMHLLYVLPSSLIAMAMLGRVGLGALLRRAAAVQAPYHAAPAGAAANAESY